MIYMEPLQLGWHPLRDSYIKTLPTNLRSKQKEMVGLLAAFQNSFLPTLHVLDLTCIFVFCIF